MKEAMGRRLDDKKTREDLSQEDLCDACATVTGNCFEKKMETHTRVFTNLLRGFNEGNCMKAAAPCANKCHWAPTLSQE